MWFLITVIHDASLYIRADISVIQDDFVVCHLRDQIMHVIKTDHGHLLCMHSVITEIHADLLWSVINDSLWLLMHALCHC